MDRKCKDRIYYLAHREKKIQKAQEYVAKNRTKTDAYQKEYRDNHKEQTKLYDRERVKKKSRLKMIYGITLGDWEKMFDAQEGRCVICGKHQNELSKGLVIDHDHITGKVRGLLCHLCNIGIGSLQDDPALLKNAISYLESKGE